MARPWPCPLVLLPVGDAACPLMPIPTPVPQVASGDAPAEPSFSPRYSSRLTRSLSFLWKSNSPNTLSRLCLLRRTQQKASRPSKTRAAIAPTTMPAIIPPDAPLPDDEAVESAKDPLGLADDVPLRVLDPPELGLEPESAKMAFQGDKQVKSPMSGSTTVIRCDC